MARTTTTQIDTENEFDWHRIISTFEDGVLTNQRTEFDDGKTESRRYTDGVLATLAEADGLANLETWTRKVTTFEPGGDIASYQVFNDDGTSTYDQFTGGIPTLSLQNFPDDGNHGSLRRIQTSFDDAGVIDRESTGYHDDRPTKFAYFTDGVVNTVVFDDRGSGGDGVKPWKMYQLNYDITTGDVTDRFITYDDGTRRQDRYEDGIIVSTTKHDPDDTANWDTVDIVYDAAGLISRRETVFDDGGLRLDTFVDGVRAETVREDLGNSYAWTETSMTYDANGQILSKDTVMDNGITRAELFEDGQRVTMVQQDIADVKAWETVQTSYEAGQIADRRVDFDNGDVSVTLYTDGDRTQTLNYDGDDSASWLLQVVDYPDAGGRVFTRYDNADDIPEALRAYFPELDLPAQGTEYVLDFNDNVRLNDGDTTLDGNFIVDVSKGQSNVQGIVMPSEYGGDGSDADLEAFNSWGATVGFTKVDADQFDFVSLSLANASRADTTYIPETNWANKVTINGYNDEAIVQSIEIDLTFEHVTHDLNWEGIDHIEFVASGGGITNDHVENAGWFSMDDLVFVA